MSRCTDEVKYWRELWRKARRFSINLPEKEWCNYWHQHFDWHSRGKQSRFEYRKHIRPLMFAFARAQHELSNQPKPYQVFVRIYPADPGSDALYIHTPNPHSEFPETFDDCQFIGVVPPLLMGLVNMERYKIGVSKYEGDKWYTVIPK